MSDALVLTDKLRTQEYRLHDKPLASGGEGEVYEIEGMPDKVAKIYYDNRLSEAKHQKLRAMTRIPVSQLPECAWPQEILYQDGNFRGFVMKKITGLGNLVEFFVYENRNTHSWKQYVVTAANVAAAVNNIHDSGIIIGDLKPDNIILDPRSGRIMLVDTDSYQIRGEGDEIFPCTVATPEYIPPELQNVNFEKAGDKEHFTEKTDDFSLAVIIFKILMNGVHPFACFSAEKSLNSLESNICHGFSPYFRNTNPGGDIKVTIRSPELSILPDNIQKLFHRAFVEGQTVPQKRPSAEEWFYALSELNMHLSSCRRDGTHVYYDKLAGCPWCGLEQEMEVRKKEYAELLEEKYRKETERFSRKKKHQPEPPRPPKKSKPLVSVSQSSNTQHTDDQNNLRAGAIALAIVTVLIILALLFAAEMESSIFEYYAYDNEPLPATCVQNEEAEIYEIGEDQIEMQ